MTTAVAVLETHMDMKPVASMKPKMMRFGLVPTILTTTSASRRCRFQRCRPSAMRKPPMNRKIVAEAYGEDTLENSATPMTGKMAMGKSAVAASGIASVIHHTAMSAVVAATTRIAWAVYSTSGSAPEDWATVSGAFAGKINQMSAASATPTIKPMSWRRHSPGSGALARSPSDSAEESCTTGVDMPHLLSYRSNTAFTGCLV